MGNAISPLRSLEQVIPLGSAFDCVLLVFLAAIGLGLLAMAVYLVGGSVGPGLHRADPPTG